MFFANLSTRAHIFSRQKRNVCWASVHVWRPWPGNVTSLPGRRCSRKRSRPPKCSSSACVCSRRPASRTRRCVVCVCNLLLINFQFNYGLDQDFSQSARLVSTCVVGILHGRHVSFAGADERSPETCACWDQGIQGETLVCFSSCV